MPTYFTGPFWPRRRASALSTARACLGAMPGRQLLKPVDQSTAEKLRHLLVDIKRRKNASYFESPVDFIALKLPAYPAIIKQPMDLGTIEGHLRGDMSRAYEAKRYPYLHDFAHDVRLVWKNAIIFNFNGNKDVFRAARDLCKVFEEKLAKLEGELEAQMDLPPVPIALRCQLLLSESMQNPMRCEFVHWFSTTLYIYIHIYIYIYIYIVCVSK